MLFCLLWNAYIFTITFSKSVGIYKSDICTKIKPWCILSLDVFRVLNLQTWVPTRNTPIHPASHGSSTTRPHRRVAKPAAAAGEYGVKRKTVGNTFRLNQNNNSFYLYILQLILNSGLELDRLLWWQESLVGQKYSPDQMVSTRGKMPRFSTFANIKISTNRVAWNGKYL